MKPMSRMNKKIFIGSLIAVAVLIGISFTSVVGYNSVTSDVKASPLFTVRSSRAINEDSKDLTCDYVGKGQDNCLSLPKRDDNAELFQKVIDRISKMDDATFKRFIGLVINHLYQDSRLRDKNMDDIVNKLKQLNFNHVDFFDGLNNNYDPPTMTPSMYNCCTILWEDPGECLISIYSPLNCFFLRISLNLLYSVLFVMTAILEILDYFSLLPEC